jgi:anti-sigma regulatory factor (Ser/Thr protein kinase)
MTRELHQAELSDHYRKVCERLDVQVGDLSNLSDLILFINTSKPIPTTFWGSQPKDAAVWEYINLDEIREEIAKTIQSIHRGRTRDPQDKKKVEILANGPELLSEKDYSRIAASLIDTYGLGSRTTFGLVLNAGDDLQYDSEKAAELAKKSRTTFLNLLLPELFLNAIKYSDPKAPEVKVQFRFAAGVNALEINIINNGTALTESQFRNVRTELANKPGEKRRALGLLLNLRAAEILGWRLEWRTPAKPGTHLALRIPFSS